MKRRLGILALIVVQFISGLNNPLIRYALHTMPIFLFGLLRVSIALAIIGPIALFARSKRPPRKRKIRPTDLWLAVGGSVLIYCVCNLAFYFGIHQSTSINAAIIGLLSPILFFMVTIEVLKERFNQKVFLGIMLAFGGSLVVVLGPMIGRSVSGGTTTGNILLVVSVLGDVIGTVILKKVLKRVHVLDVLAIGLTAATLFYFVLALPQLGQLSLLSQPKILGTVLYGAVMMGCVGYGLGYYGLAATKGSDYSIIGYLTPVVTMIAAAVFFNETFTPSLIAGGSIVFVGLYLVEARNLLHFHIRPHIFHR